MQNEQASARSAQKTKPAAINEPPYLETQKSTPTPPTKNEAFPKPEPGPFIRTSYNKSRIAHSLYGLGVVLVVGLGAAVWFNRDWLFPSVQKAFIKQPVTQLHVTKEVVNQTKLAAIPQASQASTPAQATASPNLKPQFIDPAEANKPTPELFTDLKAAQVSLQQQHINDNQSLQHYLDLATAAQNRQDEPTARQQLLDGLELAKEMQILHDYYAK